MTVCIEKNAIRGKLITNTLNIENLINSLTIFSNSTTDSPLLIINKF